MKKFLFIAAAALAMVSCSKDSEVIPSVENGKQNAIGFKVTKQNMGRAASDPTNMQNTHYNFGVFAHKATTGVTKIMEDYLVGYFDTNHKVGYYPTSAQTTFGGTPDNFTDLLSLWSYEGLGTSQYAHDTNEADENYYTASAEDTRYMSNHSNQYLRYFDYSAANTDFYAYAPYINKTALSLDGQVTFNNATKKMEFPAKSLEAGYDDPTKYEYLFSYKRVVKQDYDEDVRMAFKHLNSRIRIVFYEDIAGYDVTMMDLDANAGIIAVPANLDGTSTYTYANTLANKAQVTVEFDKYDGALDNFTDGPVKLPVGNSHLSLTDGPAINGKIKDKALVFNTPTAAKLSENRNTAVSSDPLTGGYYSATTYYGIPHNETFGLTFRVSFKLTSTTGETINVYNAGVYVANTYCAWKPGKQYTYVFKITKNTNGSTDSDDATATVDPNPGNKALYPIVFDGLTIEGWGDAVESEHPIN